MSPTCPRVSQREYVCLVELLLLLLLLHYIHSHSESNQRQIVPLMKMRKMMKMMKMRGGAGRGWRKRWRRKRKNRIEEEVENGGRGRGDGGIGGIKRGGAGGACERILWFTAEIKWEGEEMYVCVCVCVCWLNLFPLAVCRLFFFFKQTDMIHVVVPIVATVTRQPTTRCAEICAGGSTSNLRSFIKAH